VQRAGGRERAASPPCGAEFKVEGTEKLVEIVVDLQTRRAILMRLMPRMLFFMPSVSLVTTTAGWYLAVWMGLFGVRSPEIWWLRATLAIVTVMTVHGLGTSCRPISASTSSCASRSQTANASAG